MFRTTICFILWFGLLQTSCKSQDILPSNDNAASMMVLLLRDDYSGMEEEELLVIKDQKSLERFFATINRTRKPGLPVPNVDFLMEMIVVWCAGETQYPQIGLSLLNETDKMYTLRKINPHPKTKQPAIISPFFIYKMPVSEKKVVLE